MKAFSVRQPWAWLIAHGYKDIENRTWPTKFRGRVLIHASRSMTRREYEDVADFLASTHAPAAMYVRLPSFNQLQRGGIVGVATITGCIPPSHRESPWHMEGQFGFQIDDAKPLPFVECKGRLSFFDVPSAIADHLRVTHGTSREQTTFQS